MLTDVTPQGLGPPPTPLSSLSLQSHLSLPLDILVAEALLICGFRSIANITEGNPIIPISVSNTETPNQILHKAVG